ncbi:MAG: PKD domain-containing protein [Flavobacteriales bacterium]|nr:PKD domain-containing protein [Flavobacteriales bacterium]
MIRKLLLVFVIASMTLLSNNLNSQILYSEDFQGLGGVMPAAITLINNDGLIPATGVAYVTDSWVVRDELLVPNTDTCAISTSWYTPAGTSDDWMITPQITGITSDTYLSWEGLAPDVNYPDGYQVWITTSIAGATPVIADFTIGGTVLFVVAGEGQVWTPHTLSLATYAGSNVYIAFQNNSSDQFVLQIDDILVQVVSVTDADLSPTASTAEYTIIPLAQTTSMDLIAEVDNIGTNDVSDAMLFCNVYIAPDFVTPVQTTSTTLGTAILAGNTASLNAGTYTPLAIGQYKYEYIVSTASMTDTDPTNDTLSYVFSVDNDYYARDNGAIDVSLGVGVGTGAVLGNIYDINSAESIDSVMFVLSTTSLHTGDSTRVVIYDVVAGTPTTLIGQSSIYILTAADSVAGGKTFVMRVLNTSGGLMTLPVGPVFVGIEEYVSGENIGLAMSNNIFTPNKIWGAINGAFSPMEALGFSVAAMVRPRFAGACPNPVANFTESTSGSDVIFTDASATTSSTVSWAWDFGDGNTSTTQNPTHTYATPGTYTACLTVVDSCGTDSVCTSINICANPTASFSSTDSLLSVTFSDLTTTGGTITSWAWDFGDGNTSTVQNPSNTYAAGTYTACLTVGDACGFDTICNSVTVTAGPSNVNENWMENLTVYPVPASDVINISGIRFNDNFTVEVINTLGQVVLAKSFNGENNISIDVDAIQSGIYKIRLTSGEVSGFKSIVIVN